jgi:hypothetical protein
VTIAPADLDQIVAQVLAQLGPPQAGEGFPLSVATIFQAGNTIINSSGEFVYSPSPGLGNLISSVAGAAGTDQYGNAYLAGTTGYFQFGGAYYATQVGTSQQLGFYTAASGAGPWSLLASVGTQGSDLNLAANREIIAFQPVGILDQAAPAAISGRASLFASPFGQIQYVADSASDGNTYDTGRLTKIVTTNQTVNSLTPAAINQIGTIALGAATYKFRAELHYGPNQMAGTAIFAFATVGTVSASRFTCIETTVPAAGSAAASFGDGAVINTAGTFTSSTFGAADRVLVIEGSFTMGTTGSITLNAACSVAADTYVIRSYTSFLELFPIA